jgi:AcrR family transcriptional regulator
MTNRTPPTLDRSPRERILNVAERMFAEHGFELTSLRPLTAEADVNIAAVHYYFGSKEGLFEAVLQRLVGPVNEERLQLLDALEAQGSYTLEALIEAFVAPALRMCAHDPRRGAVAPRLLGRCLSSADEDTQVLLLRLFKEIIERFTAAFARALPDMPRHEVLWRLFFLVGVMAKTMGGARQLNVLSSGVCDATRPDESIPRVVEFVTAGFRAFRAGSEATS